MEVAVKAKAKRRHLNALECNGLRLSAEGCQTLKLPNINQRSGNHDPNRWLYPRTSTKRRKSRMTSPPEWEEEDEIDDISLLAAASSSEFDENQEEPDNAFLLAAGKTEEVEEEEEVDHLEGITSEMFGVNDDFEMLDKDNHSEEGEVEALPDCHYGLLGHNKVLQVPQGCIDDLSVEVLSAVLSHVPAKDLFCSVSLVCHRWRNIVQDPKFVPYKKRYFRYMLNEKDVMEEMLFTLKESGIRDAPSLQHSIQNLVVVMAQHKVGERVHPDDVLSCVKKHRLFPQAEASVRLRIPDIQKYLTHGTEGPNPYAAMAIILLLSESVGDVQALVSLLSGCMSHTGITEYLSHMATMLLAAERSDIRINSRLHYNIYYVLHLMENGPFAVGSSQDGKPQFHLTCEQQHILSHHIQKDHVVKVMAFAGTGKTTMLVKYAEQRPHLRFLYVAFNKSVACEAQRRFPRNVDCKTIHALAYSDIGRKYHDSKKLTFNLKPYTISSVLPKGRGGYSNAKLVATTLNTFMASADPGIAIDHVPNSRATRHGVVHLENDQKLMLVQEARAIWNKMKNLQEKSQHAYFMTHDGYLKVWQLQTPKPCLSDQYDVLFIDEAQDCTPAIMDVLLSQECGKILVGDPHQQIYTFRGAVNALHVVDHTHIYYLTQSFRFGAEIAFVGATILKVCKRVQKILVGGKQEGGVCDHTAVDAMATVRAGVSPCPGRTAILLRCNYNVFGTAVALTDANPHCRIHFIGDVKNIGLNKIMDIWHLVQAQTVKQPMSPPPAIRDPLIRCFARKKERGYAALRSYIEETEDLELGTKVNIVEKYGNRIPQLVQRLEGCFERHFNKADFIVGTVHKAKGMEFHTVMITDDYAKVPASGHHMGNPHSFFRKFPPDEWNMLYVAVTRAQTSLILSKSVYHILTVAGEYFLKSEMPNSSTNGGQPLHCAVTNCPNCVTPGSAFVMRKQQLKCSDGVSEGGPLCERCVWTRAGATAYLMTDDVLSMAEIPQLNQQRRFGPDL